MKTKDSRQQCTGDLRLAYWRHFSVFRALLYLSVPLVALVGYGVWQESRLSSTYPQPIPLRVVQSMALLQQQSQWAEAYVLDKTQASEKTLALGKAWEELFQAQALQERSLRSPVHTISTSLNDLTLNNVEGGQQRLGQVLALSQATALWLSAMEAAEIVSPRTAMGLRWYQLVSEKSLLERLQAQAMDVSSWYFDVKMAMVRWRASALAIPDAPAEWDAVGPWMADFLGVPDSTPDREKAQSQSSDTRALAFLGLWVVAVLCLVRFAILVQSDRSEELINLLRLLKTNAFTQKWQGKDLCQSEASSLVKSAQCIQNSFLALYRREREKNNQAIRSEQMLSSMTSCLMVLSEQGKVIFENTALKTLFKQHGVVVERDLADSFDKVMGRDSTTGHPATVALKGFLTDKSESVLILGGRDFQVSSQRLFDDAGDAMGWVLQWKDITRDLEVQQEVRSVIELALKGDFSGRIGLDRLTGFESCMGHAVNRSVAAIAQLVNDEKEKIQSLAKAPLTAKQDPVLVAQFAELQRDSQLMAHIFKETAHQIQANALTSKCTAEHTKDDKGGLNELLDVQTTVSVGKPSETTQYTGDSAQQAWALAKAACEAAENGGGAVTQAVAVMREIRQSSEKFVSTLSVINDVAFKANLLALNAMVEAAHAGEKGRGFSVVADQAGSLAQSCTEYADQMAAFVNDALDTVMERVMRVDETGEKLEEILGLLYKVSQVVAKTSTTGAEQSQWLLDAQRALAHIDKTTQKCSQYCAR